MKDTHTSAFILSLVIATEIVSEPLPQSLTTQDNTVIDSQPPNITVSDEPNKDIPSPMITEPDLNDAVVVTVDDINKHTSSITGTLLPNDFVDASTDVTNKMVIVITQCSIRSTILSLIRPLYIMHTWKCIKLLITVANE